MLDRVEYWQITRQKTGVLVAVRRIGEFIRPVDELEMWCWIGDEEN